MGSDDGSRWPDEGRTREFLAMVRGAQSQQYACFEYHDDGIELTTKALRAATEWLARTIDVLLAVDLDHRVVIASGALSAIDDDMAKLIVKQGFAGFFWDLAKAYPNQVAMVKIDRKGAVTFDRSFHVG